MSWLLLSLSVSGKGERIMYRGQRLKFRASGGGGRENGHGWSWNIMD
jgi:hypothetical protein